MDRPIMKKIIDEINALFDSMPKGAAFDQELYVSKRNEIIRKYGYRERSFIRALRSDYEEQRRATE